MIRLRRVYEDPAPEDGQRVLVDRLWPRGLARDKARIDDWCKEVAPSNELRTWYGHDPARFDEFRRRYLAELGDPVRAAALTQLGDRSRSGTVTLLTASKALEISQAAVLAGLLED